MRLQFESCIQKNTTTNMLMLIKARENGLGVNV